MTEAEARARIVMWACANDDPCLSSEEIDVFLSMARRIDDNGIEPLLEDWTPTWDINYAVAQAWLLKSNRLAPYYLFMAGGKMFSRQQFYEHCMRQYRVFLSKSPLRAYRLSRNDLLTDLVPNNWNAG